jgi:hypothetical protein
VLAQSTQVIDLTDKATEKVVDKATVPA